MYVYDCNKILFDPTKNRSDKVIIHAFSELTTDLKTSGFNQIFHVIDNKASTALKNTMTTMDINYQLVPPGNHGANNKERYIQTQKDFAVYMCTSTFKYKTGCSNKNQ